MRIAKPRHSESRNVVSLSRFGVWHTEFPIKRGLTLLFSSGILLLDPGYHRSRKGNLAIFKVLSV